MSMENPKRLNQNRSSNFSSKNYSRYSHQDYGSRGTRHAPGQIYIIIACGYHGFFPGCYLYRCKIGLAIDAKKRLKQLQSIQAPCDYKLLKIIQVSDMAKVESLLHKQFSSSNVQLSQSREWFDLTLWQVWSACNAFKYFEEHPKYGINRQQRSPWSMIAVTAAGVLIVVAVLQQVPSFLNRPNPEHIQRTIHPSLTQRRKNF